jgi:hypothetical protein
VPVRLDTIGHVKTEMGRVYRLASAGRMEWHHATRAAHILNSIARLIEGNDLEARLDRLEEILGPADKPDDARPPRHRSH